LALWREGLGAAITVGSLVIFYLAYHAKTGTFPSGWAFVVLAAPGFLFLLSWLLSRGGDTAAITGRKVLVVEQYRDWQAPVALRASIESLLALAPDNYLHGLATVVLSNTEGLPHARRRGMTRARNRKVSVTATDGLYHHAEKNQPAWIELFVDNIIRRLPLWAWRFGPFRDIELGSVLFHELGHHIHNTQMREFREPEMVAEDWARKLTLQCFQRKYPVLREFGLTLNFVLTLARRQAARKRAAADSA
jgi:hypothetical protein